MTLTSVKFASSSGICVIELKERSNQRRDTGLATIMEDAAKSPDMSATELLQSRKAAAPFTFRYL